MCVEARGLTVEAGGRKILDGIEVRVERGELAAIIGPNGSGKTTLLRALSGTTRYRGSVEVCKPHSYMPAQPEVDPLALSIDVIRAGLYGTGSTVRDAEPWATKLGVEALLYRRFSTLSSGEKRLICLVRALARKPKALLLDEPLSFLDVSNQALALRTLREYATSRRAAILVSTHEIHYLSYFDKVVLISGGRIRYAGPPSGMEEETLESVYGVPVVMLRPGVFIPRDLIEGASVR